MFNLLNSFMDFDSKYFIEINGKGLTWYATCILTGIIIAAILGVKEAKRFNISADIIFDGVLICVPLSIIGARIYYVIFALDEFIEKGNPMQSFLNMLGFTQNGFQLAGLSITGGVIVAIIFVIIYCKKRNVSTLAVFDLLAPGLLVGQIFGRWGNFFNQEAHGGAMSPEAYNVLSKIIPSFIMQKMEFYDSSLGMSAVWHPTFLYESLWNLVGLIIILICRRKAKKMRVGDTIAFYLLWYGVGRSCLIEPFRMDPLLFFGLRINIIVPVIFAIIGSIALILKHTKWKAPYYIEYQREIKENKIDGIICKVEGVLVDTADLLKNAYYNTHQALFNENLDEETLSKTIQESPEVHFKNNKEALLAFYGYFDAHYEQLIMKQNVKDFFKFLYVHDYHIVLYSSYSKEFIEYVLEALKITTFVSIIDENGNVKEAKSLIGASKHPLAIVDDSVDLKLARSIGVKSALVNYGANYEEASLLEPTYVINKFSQFNNIIVD